VAYKYWTEGACVALLLIFSLACGSGGSNTSAAPVTTPMDVSLDFDSVDDAPGKPRLSSSTSGNVEVIPVDGSTTRVYSFESNSFSLDVAPGDYEIIARRNDGRQLRAYLPSVTSGTNATASLDIDSTVAAIVKDKNNADIRSIDSILSEVKAADTYLTSYRSSGNESGQALIYNYFKSWAKEKILAGANITEETVVELSSANINAGITAKGGNLFQHLSGTVYWSGNSYATPGNVDVAGFDATAIDDITFPVTLTGEKIVVAEVAADYSSSAITVIDVLTGKIQFNNGQTYSISDLGMASYKRHIYVIGRFFADFVEKRDVDNVGVNIYDAPYSTLSSGESSKNPHDLVFASDSEALLVRYGSGNQWLVDPSASSSSSFKTSEIDLSAYDENDGIPELETGLYISGNYHLVAQRLDRTNSWVVSSNAYMIVLDSSGNEIDTGKSAAGDNLNGIALPARNPQSMVYHEATGNIYIACTGQFGSTWSNTQREFTGGILKVDPTNYEVEMLIDDDAGVNGSSNTLSGGGSYGGLFSGVEIVSSTKGYFSVYSTASSSNLVSFNPTTGDVGSAVSELSGIDLRDFVVDSSGNLWVGTSDGIKVLNTNTDVVDRTIPLDLVPARLRALRY